MMCQNKYFNNNTNTNIQPNIHSHTTTYTHTSPTAILLHAPTITSYCYPTYYPTPTEILPRQQPATITPHYYPLQHLTPLPPPQKYSLDNNQLLLPPLPRPPTVILPREQPATVTPHYYPPLYPP